MYLHSLPPLSAPSPFFPCLLAYILGNCKSLLFGLHFSALSIFRDATSHILCTRPQDGNSRSSVQQITRHSPASGRIPRALPFFHISLKASTFHLGLPSSKPVGVIFLALCRCPQFISMKQYLQASDKTSMGSSITTTNNKRLRADRCLKFIWGFCSSLHSRSHNEPSSKYSISPTLYLLNGRLFAYLGTFSNASSSLFSALLFYICLTMNITFVVDFYFRNPD